MLWHLLALAALQSRTAAIPVKTRVQPSLADKIDRVRSSVVQIVIRLEDPNALVPPQWKDCFKEARCVAGTGFFINQAGDVATAGHVGLSVSQVLQDLRARGVSATALMSVPYPNLDVHGKGVSGEIALNFQEYPIKPRAQDIARDLFVYSPARNNPFTDHAALFGVKDKGFQLSPQVAPIAPARVRDGDDILACGFPLGSDALISTVGHVAASWARENLLTARNNGISEESDVYNLDLRTNPGNSGGPVFRLSDQSVIGVDVEVRTADGGSSEGVAVAVPSKYLVELLKSSGIEWREAWSPQAGKS